MREKECNEKEIGISIIVPVYNVEKYLAICIRSLLAQSYKNIEIILVDDGSTDTSGAICDKFAAQSSKIQVIHKKNGGLSSARNAGLAMAGGRYIGFVDSDDYVLPTMYEKLMDAARYTPSAFSFTGEKVGGIIEIEFCNSAFIVKAIKNG
mgnify:CR=1 FL=1